MATERARTPDNQTPYPDELDPPITDSDEVLPITAEDIASSSTSPGTPR